MLAKFNFFPSLVNVKLLALTLVVPTITGLFKVTVTFDKSNASIFTVFLFPSYVFPAVTSKSVLLSTLKLEDALIFEASNLTVN